MSITHFSVQKPLNLYAQQKSFGHLLYASVLEAEHTEAERETWDLTFQRHRQITSEQINYWLAFAISQVTSKFRAIIYF